MVELLVVLNIFAYGIFGITYLVIPWFGAPLVATKKQELEDVIKSLKIDKNKKVIDLGCGVGTFVAFMGGKGYKVDGIDLNPFLVLISRIRARIVGADSKIYFGNILNKDLSSYDVVYCYLMPEIMEKLKKKFEKELKPGSIIISNTFRIKGKEPLKKYNKIKIYKY